jgi:sec-independent protein translocase protein TatA
VALAVTLTRPQPAVNLPGMFGLGATELLIILAIVVLLFGARRLPEIGSGLGKAIRGFKEGISGKDAIDVTPKKDEVPEGKKP